MPRPAAGYNAVSPEYIDTIRPRLIRGRFFTHEDDQRGRPVAIVNEYMASRYWPNQEAIGKRFRSTDLKNEWLEIVGVVRNGKQTGLFADPEGYFYVPIAQQYKSLRALQVRVAGDPAALAPLIAKEIRALDPDLPMFDVITMERMIQGPNGFFLLRMGALFGGALGLLGLALALVGVYGVVSYAASQRTQEIGVRMALGATAQSVFRLVLGQALKLVGIGVVLGVVIAGMLTRLLETLLFETAPLDPVTFAATAVVLMLVATLASYVPARRSTRVAPIEALRAE